MINSDFKNELAETMIDKVESILDDLPELIEAMAEIVALILDPWEEDKDISKTWVMANLNSHRILAIVTAQVEVNKFRDFFSGGLRLSKTLR